MTLRVACNCSICLETNAAQEVYCLVLLVEMVVAIARLLSAARVPKTLMPSRLGLEEIYSQQFNMRADNEAW